MGTAGFAGLGLQPLTSVQQSKVMRVIVLEDIHTPCMDYYCDVDRWTQGGLGERSAAALPTAGALGSGARPEWRRSDVEPDPNGSGARRINMLLLEWLRKRVQLPGCAHHANRQTFDGPSGRGNFVGEIWKRKRVREVRLGRKYCSRRRQQAWRQR